ncbi:hypothetical protein STEG23_013994, partial [Scotinomys teguina]
MKDETVFLAFSHGYLWSSDPLSRKSDQPGRKEPVTIAKLGLAVQPMGSLLAV